MPTDRDTLIGKPLDGECALLDDVNDDVNAGCGSDELASGLEWDTDCKLTTLKSLMAKVEDRPAVRMRLRMSTEDGCVNAVHMDRK